jgi:hypothetical protein
MLLLVRNFVPAHEQIERGQWNVADVARNSFDLEGKVIGTVGAGVGSGGSESARESSRDSWLSIPRSCCTLTTHRCQPVRPQCPDRQVRH